MLKGTLSKTTITASNSAFSLKGMINPSFTNMGASPVIIDGRKLETGDNFSVFCPGVVLQNEIAIRFTDAAGTKSLFCHYVEIIECEKECIK